MKTKLLIVGAGGRMGKRILELAKQQSQFEVIGAVERADHSDIGKDTVIEGVKLSDSYAGAADVVVDFSSANVVEKTISYCVENVAAAVMGVTGLSDKVTEKIREASKTVPVIYGTNMSIGMNILFDLVSKAAAKLGDDYDIEIVEQHHRFKKDAPSGSALTLAENICKSTGMDYPGCLVHGRVGNDTLRQKGTIGMHSVRAGDICGVHTVLFSTLGESIELNHRASSRDAFASGALRAAGWLVGKKPGLYSMADCLGLK